MERRYTASAYVIDFDEQKVLLMYNKKLEKWLQPGGHIEGLETPEGTAIREVKEETGIDIKIISINDYDNVVPIAVERYINKVGDMIDLQYLAIPLNNRLVSDEDNDYGWFSLSDLENMLVGEDIKTRVKDILNRGI